MQQMSQHPHAIAWITAAEIRCYTNISKIGDQINPHIGCWNLVGGRLDRGDKQIKYLKSWHFHIMSARIDLFQLTQYILFVH